MSMVASDVTVYGPYKQQTLGIAGTATAASASYTGSAAYNPTTLTPPPVPNPPPPSQFNIQLQNGGVPGLSIPQKGSFLGFSVEFSVVTQIRYIHSSFLQVPFLNLMANIRERAGSINIRVGGNTQDSATLVSSIADGADLEKDYSGSTNPTATPPTIFTSDIMKMMLGISNLVNVRWYMGLPFYNTSNFRLEIAEAGESILGDNLIGLQVGNEPDLYSRHGHRPANYGPSDYVTEFGQLVTAMQNDANVPNQGLLIGPNLAGVWSPEDIWNTGFVQQYNQELSALAVERYPSDNCYATFGIGTPRTGQEMFPSYLTHQSGIDIVSSYLNSTNYAQSVGKPFLMFETNTASCGGFPGLSDSFGAALWGLDYSLQMAYSNFSGALMHVSGQDVYYNVPPPTNQSTFHQWTIGPIYYSALVMAEVLGSSNASQVVDLQANGNNEFTPGYAIYEHGQPMRVALFNYVSDPTGASDYTASISISGGMVPAQVNVKYLAASSVAQKYNFTWAGQTFGDVFSSDGRPVGQLDVQTVTCDQSNNVCSIHVPAPGFALVFLNGQASSESDSGATMTFPTTAYTKTENTVTIDQAVLATSNDYILAFPALLVAQS
ncbi:glycoside hydrolase family 79 protein [Serpula lacrymans var. lacrymans S7.9]|uniref:Glycoside hydrolase family 79 protein n=1 Tax=Serpula lacrymans var. lacrymans (strain S7.9) TaxID=578457 RepID=F8P9D9_SERL9|nr:glycoside hydrolase family 79 protein [Serpula lacrymans var. lacrymans S7.9]EGO20268.1 glycoside hydrolase family 79 protein [Serpula lacrymans var. lacrymans S7.9]